MMLPQNYNVAFKKQLGKVYNFKFGFRVTIKMQIKATMVGWLVGEWGSRILKTKFQPQGPLGMTFSLWVLTSSYFS